MGVIIVLLLAIIVILLGGGTLVLWSAGGVAVLLLLGVIIAAPVFVGVAIMDWFGAQDRAVRRHRWRRLRWVVGVPVVTVTISLGLLWILINPRFIGPLAVGIVGWLTLWYGGSLIIDWYHARSHHTGV